MLTKLMKENKMTLKEAAKVSGVSSSTISDWRSGTSPEDYMAVQKVDVNHVLWRGCKETKVFRDNEVKVLDIKYIKK